MMRVDCPNLEMNLADCPCTSADCERRGFCCKCVRNHKEHGNYPACLRYEPS